MATVLAEARSALGGEARLQAITSFTAKGTSWRARGHSRYPGSFELACELPDKFVRRDIKVFNPGPEQQREVWRIGFVGVTPIFDIQGSLTNADLALRDLQSDGRELLAYGAATFPPLPADQARRQRALTMARLDFVQVTLAFFARSFPSVPLQFLEAAGTPEGSEIIVQGDAPVIMRFDKTTHLPAALGSMEFSRYRDLDGMRVPFRFVIPATQASAKATDGWERGWEISEVHFNVKIDPKVFAIK